MFGHFQPVLFAGAAFFTLAFFGSFILAALWYGARFIAYAVVGILWLILTIAQAAGFCVAWVFNPAAAREAYREAERRRVAARQSR